jgi:hypothetical protein
LIFIDEISSRFCVLAAGKSLPDGQDTPTDPIASVEYGHAHSLLL